MFPARSLPKPENNHEVPVGDPVGDALGDALGDAVSNAVGAVVEDAVGAPTIWAECHRQ